MTKLYAALSLILSTTAIGGSSEQFSLLSQDGLATLSGQIDFPEGNTLPLVVMVPGTGLFDRDVDFAAPGSENGLIFKALSQELNRLGFAVLRHDYRGVKCSLSNAPACPSCKTPQERRDHFIRSCLDNSIRATVTPENIRDDIHSIYELGKNHKRIDPSRITVFGHSEGSLHLSHLIKDERIQPKAALFMGGLAESPSSVVRWQMIGRFIDAFLGMDSDRDGTISNDEIKRGHASSRLNNFPLEYLLSTTGGWDQESLLYWRQKEYESMRTDALVKPDTTEFKSGNIVQASFRWWKMYFSDENQAASLLSHFSGPVVFCNGDRDAQTDFDRQKRVIDSLGKSNIRIERFSGMGHTLGDDPIFGPISPESLKKLLATIGELSEL